MLARENGFAVETAFLEDLAFSKQLRLFRTTDVYVCQQGTALHNVLFMRPGSAVIIIMQPDWCDWRWQFADQAAYLGMHVFVYCSDANRFSSTTSAFRLGALNISGSYRWNQRAWLEGPWYSKEMRQSVDRASFASMLAAARASLGTTPTTRTPYRASGKSAKLVAPPSRGVLRAIARIADVVVSNPSNETRRFSFTPEVVLTNEMDPRDLHATLPHLEFCIRPVGTRSGNSVSVALGKTCFESDLLGTHAPLDLVLPLHLAREGFIVALSLQDGSSGSLLKGSETISSISLLETIERVSNVYGKQRVLAFPFLENGELQFYSCDLRSKRHARDVCAFELSLACTKSGTSWEECATIFNYADLMLHKESEAAAADLPAIQPQPRSNRPFYFLHLEKTAGTCLRHHLAKYGSGASVIPCQHGLHCMTFTLNADDRDAFLDNDSSYLLPYLSRGPSIVAGHFEWGSWNALGLQDDDIACYTTARDPLRRALSLYYERLYPANGRKRFGELTTQELEYYLMQWRGSAHGRWRDEGMSNAACRMFCGQNNLKGRLPNAARLDRNEPCTFEIARLRLSQCVVGMQEKWNDTLRVLGRWAPWIDTRDACPSGSAGRNEGVRAEQIGDLPVASSNCCANTTRAISSCTATLKSV